MKKRTVTLIKKEITVRLCPGVTFFVKNFADNLWDRSNSSWNAIKSRIYSKL